MCDHSFCYFKIDILYTTISYEVGLVSQCLCTVCMKTKHLTRVTNTRYMPKFRDLFANSLLCHITVQFCSYPEGQVSLLPTPEMDCGRKCMMQRLIDSSPSPGNAWGEGEGGKILEQQHTKLGKPPNTRLIVSYFLLYAHKY